MNMKEIARFYISHGWSIIPLRWKSKLPACKWGEYRYRYMNEEEIDKWFVKKRNIGIITGRFSGIIVLDYDGNFDHPLFEKLMNIDTLTVKTGKGYHFYFHALPDIPVNSRNRILPFLDIRGENGYVVAPPSIHENGKEYKYLNTIECLKILPESILKEIYDHEMVSF